MLSTGDLIVQETQLHFPTVINFLGAAARAARQPRSTSSTSSSKALGATSATSCSRDPVTSGPTTPSSWPPP